VPGAAVPRPRSFHCGDTLIPVHECTLDGKPGWQWGDQGTCYTFDPGSEASRNEAKRKAHVQQYAAEQNGAKSIVAEKSFTVKHLEPLAADDALTAINRFTRRSVTAEEVFIGRASLANDLHDKSGERFPPAYLERFAETIIGAPVLEAHDKKRSGVGKWFGAAVEKDAAGYSHLITDFYLDARSDLARRVDLGIASDVSIGVMVPKGARACDLCGKAYDGGCTHNVLEEYAGKVCTLTYGGDLKRVRAIEGSFVGIGCQHGAQVMRAKVWAPGGLWVDDERESAAVDLSWAAPGDEMEKAELEERVKVLETENELLKKDASLIEDGRAFHAYLLEDITKAYGILKRDPAAMVKLLTNADVETLKEHRAGLMTEIDEKFPPSPVSKQMGEGGTEAPPDGGRQAKAKPLNPFFAGQGVK
jgi:hypothetical protein